MSIQAQLVLVFSGAALAIIALCIWGYPLAQNLLSKLVDRYRLRPSFVGAMLELAFLGYLVSWFFFLPQVMAYRIVMAILISSWFASVLEKLRRPPTRETWPSWYRGKGDPGWKRRSTRAPANETLLSRFSLSWLVIMISTLCLFLATFGGQVSRTIKQDRLHRAAVKRIADLGITLDGTALNLPNAIISQDDLEVVLGYKGLQHLQLGGANITDEALIPVSKLEELRSLVLAGARITDDGLKHLVALPQLKMLVLSGTRITDDGLKHVRNLPELRELYLGNTNITDTGLGHLEGVELQRLWIEHTKVTGTGLGHLNFRPIDNPGSKMSMLNLSGCPLTKTGLEQIIKLRPGSVTLDRTSDAGQMVLEALPQGSVTHLPIRAAP